MPSAEEMFNDAVRLHQSGQLAQAERSYKAIAEAEPNHAGSHCNLGVVLAQQGRAEEAVKAYQKAIELQPQYPDARFNLGNALRGLGRMAEAAQCYQAVLRLEPEHLGGTFNLGLVFWGTGQWEQARQCFEKALRMKPDLVEARNHLGYSLHRLGKIPEAIATYRELLNDHPEYVRGYHNLGLALSSAGRHDEAEACFQRALHIQPDYAEAHNSYGVTLEALGRPDEALEHYERAVQLKPRFGDALNNLGIAYTEIGRHDEAIECRRMALELEPEKAHVHSNLLLTMNYSADVTPEELYEEHKSWAKLHADQFTATYHSRNIDYNPNRKLRIGYVSADFRQHTVASFLVPLFANHDHEGFHVTAFSNVRRPDEMTEKLRGYADDWQSIHGMSDGVAAALVREKEIDILVDLSGHTAGNRLLLFAAKPAPIALTLFGYPNTTGMGAIDYRVTDSISDPPDTVEHFHTEDPLRLSRTPWVYEPGEAALKARVGGVPSEETGHLTFGSMNNPAKITAPMIRAWAEILHEVKGSRLLMLVGRNGFGANLVVERFAEHGVGPDRLEFVNRAPAAEYFEMYNRIDVLLDTYPYNGGVTSCDAFWMGVPMVTLAGKTYVSRQGLMMLTHLGLKDLAASSPADYVATASRAVKDGSRLRTLREGLRERFRGSPLMNAGEYVADLESAYRNVWRLKSTRR